MLTEIAKDLQMRLWMIAGAIGIASASFFSKLPEPIWLLLLFIPFLLSFKHKNSVLLGALCLGLCWGLGYGIFAMQQRLPIDIEGIDVNINGQVVGLVSVSGRVQRFEFKVLDSSHNGNNAVLSDVKIIRLSWYQTKRKISSGEFYNLIVRLKKPHGFSNPGGFNYETWLFQKGIAATGYVRQAQQITTYKNNYWNISTHIDVIRSKFSDQLSDNQLNYANAGIMKALLIGVKNDIDKNLWQLFTKTGTNHLFVISGLHVGFVAMCAWWLVILLSRILLFGSPPIAAQQMAAIGALLVSFIYCMMAGFSLPTQRALIMLVVMLAGKIFKIQTDVWTGYCLALLLVLLLDPLAVQMAGFWLSFGAVGALLYGYSSYCSNKGFWWRWGRPQWVVFVAFIPVLIWLFAQFSLVSPVVNLVAIPLVGFVIVPLCLLGGLLMMINISLAMPFLWCADKCLTYLIWIMEYFAQWPNILIQTRISEFQLVLALIGVLLLLSPRGLPMRRVGFIPLLLFLLPINNELEIGEYRATILDVGQGLAIVIETQNRTVIYDVGAKYSDNFNAVDAAVMPYLKYHNIKNLDLVVISHKDNDHAGALPYLLQSMSITNLISGSVLNLKDRVFTDNCPENKIWHWDEVTFHLMRANKALWTNENNRSCVLKVSNDYNGLLIPGDIDTNAEFDLISRMGKSLQADVLIAPHHGSNTSSSQKFIDTVKPKIVIYSAGYRNRYKHPRKIVMQRYSQHGIEQLNSASSGAVIITATTDSNSPEIIEQRKTFNRYWF